MKAIIITITAVATLAGFAFAVTTFGLQALAGFIVAIGGTLALLEMTGKMDDLYQGHLTGTKHNK